MLSGIGLALATAAVLLSGHAATGVHLLIGAGLQGTFSLLHEHRGKGARPLLEGAFSLSAGLLFGFLLSAPQTVPTLEYVRARSRPRRPAAGSSP